MTSKRRALPPTSRYSSIDQVETELSDGRRVVHLRRRFVPRPETLSTVTYHQVRTGERIDHVAAEAIGDPTAWWQLADANGVMDPEDLIRQADAVVRIALPEGVHGA